MKSLLIGSICLLPVLAMAQLNCYQEMWANPAMKPVIQRLDTSAPGAEVKLRASTAKPTPKEKEALAFMLDAMLACQKADQEARKNMPPEGQAILQNFAMDMNALVTKLYASRITWGEFVEGRDRASADFSTKAQAFDAKLKLLAQEMETRQKQAEAQAEEQRKAALRADFERQQRADAQQRLFEQQQQEQAARDITNGLLLLNAARPQPMPNTLMRPPISCTSRSFNGTVHTDCN